MSVEMRRPPATCPAIAATGRATLAAVVLNYNYAEYLPQAIDSLLAQTVAFDEIVVVNDGSTDDSMAVLERYRESVTVIDIANRGQLGACRAGLDAVGSDYVYFLDADDYASEHLVAGVSDALAGGPVKVQFQMRAVSPVVDLPGTPFPVFPAPYEAREMREDNASLGFYICPPTSGNIFRRAEFAAMPLAEMDQRESPDGPITLVLPYLGEVATIPEPLAYYRMHGRNRSQGTFEAPAIQAEIDWFERRWRETWKLLGQPGDEQVSNASLYVVERRMMIAALENRHRATAVLVARFVRGLLRSHTPRRRVVMLAAWALCLVIPSGRLRRSSVRSKRAPLTRTGGIQRLVAVLLVGRAKVRRTSEEPA